MISVSEARSLLQQHITTTCTLEVSLYDALDMFVAEDITAPIDMPSFSQSAMDGYAFRFEDYEKNIPLYNEGEIAAGTTLVSEVDPEHCIQIFTGALVPPGVDMIVMQEQVMQEGKHILIQNRTLEKGANIRQQGAQTKKGDILLKKGDRLNAASCSMLASFGFEKVLVHKKPTIDILVTGNELMRPPELIKAGRVYESNSYALKNVLKAMQLDDIRIRKAGDLAADVASKISDGLKADVLIITGGISVGKYDLVKEALEENGVEEIFHKINQKPGKPIYVGKKGATIVFALPGNPGSVMNCFYIYVKKALEQIMGSLAGYESNMQLRLKDGLTKKGNRSSFLKGKWIGDKVETLQHQASFKLNGFAVADVLIELDENITSLDAGDKVKIHKI